MDGNGRWATSRNLPRVEGHRRGVASVRTICEAAAERGIEVLTLYCLSSENWKRPQTELDFLMTLLRQYLIEERSLMIEQNLRLQTIGRRDRLPAEVIEQIEQTASLTRQCTGTRLVLALDYGGRDELCRAVRSIADRVRSGTLDPDTIDEGVIAGALDTASFPEVDLVIRTGGDHRISNFLLWQINYAELYVTPTPWPEFGSAAFDEALDEYARRHRRFGGL